MDHQTFGTVRLSIHLSGHTPGGVPRVDIVLPTVGMEMHTFRRVKELLQSSGGFLQFFILLGLEDHLCKVKVFDQPCFRAAL